MLIVAVIAFIAGAIIALIGLSLFTMHYTNMSFDEISAVGGMFIEAGNNRESAMVLHKDGVAVDTIVFEER